MKAMVFLLMWLPCVSNAPAVELIADPSFQRGFAVKDREGKRQVIRWNDQQTAVWNTAQHHSKSSFSDKQYCRFHKNGFTFKDAYQEFVVHPEGGDADLIFGVNGFKEFGGVHRKSGEPWPHQYVDQTIVPCHDHPQKTRLALTNIERLDLTIRVRLLYDRQNKSPAYDPHRHTAQFVLFLTIQNLNRQSKGYGDYYWFGAALYDSREKATAFHAMQDKGSAQKKGTDKLIYNVGIAPFASDVVADGKWVTVRGDVLPHIRAGLQESWKRGYLAGSDDMADYGIGSVVIGWEVTGLNDVAMAVKDLAATATVKSK